MSSISFPSSRQKVNRRGKARYELNSPVHYRVMLQERRSPWKQGTVLDMSATGMLVDLQSDVEPGNEIELVMDWNGLYHGKEKMRLRLTVEVVRCEPRGIAVRIMEHQFEEVAMVVPPRYVKRKARLAVA